MPFGVQPSGDLKPCDPPHFQEKMDVVWSFVKAHLENKTIVFLSTCKQVGSPTGNTD